MQNSIIPSLNSIFKGEVVSIKDYGAFVKIPGCFKNGLIHKSQISRVKVDEVNDVINVKDHVWCKVISLGDNGDKISLSMKVVNQRNGEDLDPNGVEIGQDEKRRKSYTPFIQQKITLEAVYNTVCKKCGIKGHLSKDCFQIPGGKTYDLLPDVDNGESPNTKQPSEDKTVGHRSDRTHKRRHSSRSDDHSPNSSSFVSTSKEKKSKKKKRHKSKEK